MPRFVAFTLAAFAIVWFYRRAVHANQTTVALSYLILILFTAFRGRLAYSIYLSVLCTLLYNFYFLPPLGSFAVADPRNLIALFVFLAAAISVNQVSARERRQAHALEIRRSEVEKLYEFSQRLLLEARVAESVPALVARSFHVNAVALYLPERDAAVMWDPDHLLDGMEDLRLATQPEEVSSRSVAGVRGDIRIVPLMLGMRALGALAIAEHGYSEGLYDAIGSLTAILIERATALDREGRVEAARQGEQLRAALLDSIAHELRTPLTGIRVAATTLLTEPALDEAARLDLASVIGEESARLERLIDEAVVMAQLGAGEVHVRRQPASIECVMEQAVADARARLRARQVKVDVETGIPEVPMDAELIRRVWKHLLENAAQYSPEGTPIRLGARYKQGKLIMRVEDEGPGIAEDEQALLFKRFFRGGNRALHPEGTGMGLAIVKAILEAHGGGIGVESAPGQGTAFSFWIPADAPNLSS